MGAATFDEPQGPPGRPSLTEQGPKPNAAKADVPSVGAPLPERLEWPPIRSGIEKRFGVAGPSLLAEGRHHAEPMSVERKPENACEEGQA